MKYRTRSTKVEALQWDGTESGFLKIREQFPILNLWLNKKSNIIHVGVGLSFKIVQKTNWIVGGDKDTSGDSFYISPPPGTAYRIMDDKTFNSLFEIDE